jgi:hypothetical protein
MVMSASNDSNRRNYSRVDVYIPVEFRFVPDDERKYVKSKITGEVILADHQLMPPLEDRPHLSWVLPLNNKLDGIIRTLTLRYEGFHMLPSKFVTISGNGMSFSSQQSYALGDLLEIKALLTLYKSEAFYLYGEVVKTRKQTSGHHIAVVFRMIDDGIQDRIIRYVFEMERELLRERSRTDYVS